MSSIGKSAGNQILTVAVILALFISPGLLVRVSVSADLQAGPPTAGNPKNQELENNLKILREGESYEKHRAVIALGSSGNPAAVEPLVKALGDSDFFVRSFAATALGNLKDPRAVAPLIKALSDENQRVRRSAAEALGSLGRREALDPLIKALDDENVFVRRSAAQALGNLGDPAVLDPLIGVLRDSESYVWNGASIALMHLGNSGIPKLINALGDWTLGPRIAEVLKSLNWQPSSDEEKVRFDVACRNKQALSQNWDIARKMLFMDANGGNSRQAENAVYALIGIGREEALDALASVLRKKGSLEMASAYLKSGSTGLAEIARNWAKEQGKEIPPGDNAAPVQWGSLRPQ